MVTFPALSSVRQSGRRALSTTHSILSRQPRRNQATLKPSTIDTGFILSLAKLPNPATSDPAYQRILSWYLPETILRSIQPDLERFGEEAVSDETNDLISNAERQPPYVKTRNVWGDKYASDRLVTSQGWKELGRWGVRNGLGASSPGFSLTVR